MTWSLQADCSGENCAPKNKLCTCKHFHGDAGPCPEKRCKCQRWDFDKSWQWFWSHGSIRDELDAGGDLHHANLYCLWQLLVFDKEQGYNQLSDEQRGRLRALAESREALSAYDQRQLSGDEALEVGEWLDHGMTRPQRLAAFHQGIEADAERRRQELAEAVEAGSYAGPPVQGGLL